MFALTILGILVALAVPGFMGLVEEFQVDGKQRNFISGLKYAQSEAVKRNSNVTMCVASTTSNDTCDTTSANDWDQGWYIFDDANADQVINTPATEILRSQNAVNNVTFVTTADVNAISFNGNGAILPGAPIMFTFCHTDSDNADCCSTDEYRSMFTSLPSGQLVIVPN